MGFSIKIPRKRERNVLVIMQAKGEAQRPQRMENKKYKKQSRQDWKKEDWGN